MTTPTTVQVRFQFRADTAANWTSIDPILLANELGRETDTGKIKIGDGTTAWSSLAYQGWSSLTYPLVNADIDAAAAIDHSKLADITAGSVLLGNASNVPTATALSGDVTVNSSGVTAIGSGVIVDADVSATAEIAVSKLANGTANQILTTDGTDVSWTDSPTIAGNVIISGNLTVNGTETVINVETLQVEDHQIEIGNVTTPSDLTADNGGIVLKGSSNKTILWIDSTDSWTSSENVDLASGKTYKIAGTDVLSATTLGSGVTGSSLTSVGNLTDLTVDTDTLVVDATNDRVGVNTATPANTLDVTSANTTISSTSTGNSTAKIALNSNRAASVINTQILGQWNGNTVSRIDFVNGADDVNKDDGSISFLTANNSSNPLPRMSIAQNGDVAIDTDTLYVDATNNRVGVGASAPDTRLTVDSSTIDQAVHVISSDSNVRIKLTDGDATNSVFIAGKGDDLAFETAGNNERVRIDSAGRLLVGTSTTTADASQILEGNSASDTGSGNLLLARGQDTPADGIGLGQLSFTDNTHTPSSQIIGRRDGGTWSATSKPTSLDFRTTPDGSDSTSRRMIIGANGNITIGTGSATSSNNVYLSADITGGASAYGYRSIQEIQADVTSTARPFSTSISTADNGGTGYTVSNLRHFEAIQGTFHADSTVSSQIAFRANANLNDATNNFGFVSDIDDEAGHGNFNFYASGTADNYFAGNVGIGVTSPGYELDVRGTSDTSIRIQSTGTGSSDSTILRQSIGGTTASNFIFFGDSDDSNAGQIQYNHNSDALTFNTNGTLRMTLDSSGRVMLGASVFTGATRFAIRGNTSSSTGSGNIYLVRGESSADMADNDLVGMIRFSDEDDNRSAEIRSTIDGTPSATATPGELSFWTTAAGAVASTQRMTIDSSGNVGIGNVSPSAPLQVQGSAGEIRIQRPTASQSDWSMQLPSSSGEFQIYDNNNTTARLTIDSSGNVGIGDSAPLGQLSIRNTSGTTGFYLTRATSTSFGDVVSCRILTTSTTPRIYGYGDGLTFWTAAVSGTAAQRMTIRDDGNVGIGTGSPSYELDVNGSIRAQTQGRFANGTAGAPSYAFNGDADTGMYRYTTNAIGFSTGGTARLVITGAGTLRPDTDDTQLLGAASYRWSDIYAGNGTIQTSDAKLKQDVEDLEQAELNVATAIKGLIKKYRFTKAVEEKGDDARIHVGVIAQDVEQAFIAEGLDPRRYALFCEDTLEDGTKRLGIRYSELLAFVIAAL